MRRILFFIFCFNLVATNLIGATALPPTKEQFEKNAKKSFCDTFNKKIKEYQWGKIICNPDTWSWDSRFLSPKGYPLVHKVFEQGNFQGNTTLLLCGVHGDEIPSPYLCVHLVRDILFDSKDKYQNSRIVIAPLVTPDSFFIDKPTRTNANGIDINRNFPTVDFDKLAVDSWKSKYGSDKRRFPGNIGGSEIETQFQIMLIETYKPDKIISIHSPYGWLDVDVPPEKIAKKFSHFFQQAKDVGHRMSEASDNYPMTNFKIFPGSLGTYAAHERQIPTYTLELPTSGANAANKYWVQMRKGFIAAINYQINTISPLDNNQKENKQDYLSEED